MSFNRIAQGRQQQQQQQQQGSDGASLARRIQHNAELFRVRDDNSHSESSAEESEDGRSRAHSTSSVRDVMVCSGCMQLFDIMTTATHFSPCVLSELGYVGSKEN